MIKAKGKIVTVFMAVVLCMLMACADTNTPVIDPPESDAVVSISLKYNNAAIPGNALTANLSAVWSMTFTADVVTTGNASKDFTLASSASAVASVSDKTVSLWDGGTATITATAAGDATKTHSILITVIDDIEFIPGSNQPLHITNSFGQDASSEFIVQWHNTVSGQSLQITTKNDKAFRKASELTEGDTGFTVREFAGTAGANQIGSFSKRNIFRTDIKGLTPGTDYIYRVGSETDGWSPAQSVTTAPGTGDFSFTVVTDMQNAPSSAHLPFQTAMNAAEAYDPDSRFSLNLGDLVEEIALPFSGGPKSGMPEIESYTEVAAGFNNKKPIMSTQGNHDTYYWNNNSANTYIFGNAAVFNAYTTNPFNGPAQQLVDANRSQSYYFYYNSVLIIMLNTMISQNGGPTTAAPTAAQHSAQAAWLKGVLDYDRDNHLSRYTVVGMHVGPFSSRNPGSTVQPGSGSALGWIEPFVRGAYCKIFSDYEVDAVFYGHDHNYARTDAIVIGADGRTNTDLTFNNTTKALVYGTDTALDFTHRPDIGTYYVMVGSCGDKFYDLPARMGANAVVPDAYFPVRTMNEAENDGGMFLNIAVTSAGLTVSAQTILGREIDNFMVLPKRPPVPVALRLSA